MSNFSCATNKREKTEDTKQKDFFPAAYAYGTARAVRSQDHFSSTGTTQYVTTKGKIPILKTDSLEGFWLLMTKSFLNKLKSPKDPSVSLYIHPIILGKFIWIELGVVNLTHVEDNFLTNECKFQFKIKLQLQNVQSKEI